jgi:SAM-dependent MidA family methyltransferase
VRHRGTLEAFQGQRVTRDVLAEPGSRDITAWVDFTELEEALLAEGLTVRGLVSQARLLLAAGLGDELRPADPERPETAAAAAERNAIGKLVAPGGMGEEIRVLVAERGTSAGAGLMRLPGLT